MIFALVAASAAAVSAADVTYSSLLTTYYFVNEGFYNAYSTYTIDQGSGPKLQFEKKAIYDPNGTPQPPSGAFVNDFNITTSVIQTWSVLPSAYTSAFPWVASPPEVDPGDPTGAIYDPPSKPTNPFDNLEFIETRWILNAQQSGYKLDETFHLRDFIVNGTRKKFQKTLMVSDTASAGSLLVPRIWANATSDVLPTIHMTVPIWFPSVKDGDAVKAFALAPPSATDGWNPASSDVVDETQLFFYTKRYGCMNVTLTKIVSSSGTYPNTAAPKDLINGTIVGDPNIQIDIDGSFPTRDAKLKWAMTTPTDSDYQEAISFFKDWNPHCADGSVNAFWPPKGSSAAGSGKLGRFSAVVFASSGRSFIELFRCKSL